MFDEVVVSICLRSESSATLTEFMVDQWYRTNQNRAKRDRMQKSALIWWFWRLILSILRDIYHTMLVFPQRITHNMQWCVQIARNASKMLQYCWFCSRSMLLRSLRRRYDYVRYDSGIKMLRCLFQISGWYIFKLYHGNSCILRRLIAQNDTKKWVSVGIKLS